MKVSAFTFIKNGELLGYPFIESIMSVLPIVDEFVVNVGDSEDNTLDQILKIQSKKIKVIKSSWNENMQNKGYVYGQQKMIAQFNCSGDWAFYVEGDEVYHEQDLKKITQLLKDNHKKNEIEAIAFKFIHFYGNKNSFLDSPGWYRSEVRIIRNTIRTYAPDGLFWVVLNKNKNGRYPKAIESDVNCYHYGWVRSEKEMNLKSKKVNKYWGSKPKKINYSNIDQKIIKKFTGSHPKVLDGWLDQNSEIFKADSGHKLSFKEKKHRVMLAIEKIFRVDLSKKHYSKVG